MTFSYRCIIILRRLTIELLEFFASAQFVPFICCAGIAAFTLVANIAGFSGRTVMAPERLIALAYRPLWQTLLIAGLAVYAVLRLPRAVRSRNKWWSTRRKAAIALSAVILLYMMLFAMIFITTRQAVPSVWIILFGVTIVSALYGFTVRYIANNVIRRLSRPDFYQPLSVPVAAPSPKL